MGCYGCETRLVCERHDAPRGVVPCECGSTEAYWHGPEHGTRVYCCDACWSGAKLPESSAHLAGATLAGASLADAVLSEITGTVHDGLCESCDAQLTRANLTEGDLGFYCSRRCLSEAEGLPAGGWREDFHSDG